MEIAIAYHDTVMAGIKRYALEMIRAYQGMGHAVKPTPIRGKEFTLFGRKVGGILTYRAARALTHPRARVVHCASHHALVRTANVVSIHDLILLKYPDLFHMTGPQRRFEEGDIRRALTRPLVMVDTAHVKRDIMERYGTPDSKIRVAHLGIDRDTFHPDPERPAILAPDRINLLTMGDLNPRKRVDLLIKAVDALGDPRLRIVHVGAWHGVSQFADELRATAKALEARGQYVYGGKVTDAELRRLYSHADLFVIPTLDEGFGFPPLEAMACGCNVLASDIPPLRETLEGHATFAPLTVEGFAQGIERALKERRPAERLTQHAATFTWDRCARETLDAYRDVLGAQ